jgi:biopolymer transport protein ExbB/TolQ
MIAATGIEDVLFHIANALRVPVFIAAGIALAFLLFDLGAFFIELMRRGRSGRLGEVELASQSARAALGEGDRASAQRALLPLASSAQMADTLALLVGHHGEPGASDRRAKALADFDLSSLRKLERSRMLVRFGPALGLMGTLIPLSPALDGLAKGDVSALSENLRVAFSVTVLGLLIGAVAFAISLVRDRLYAQDLSDLEYVVAQLDPGDSHPLEPEHVQRR